MKNAPDALHALITEAELSQLEIASVLDLSVPAVSNKLAGRRPWAQTEINKLLALLSARLRRRITYEKAFPSEPIHAGKV